jgi:hypothetical protein
MADAPAENKPSYKYQVEDCEPLKGETDADMLQFGIIWQVAAAGLAAASAVVAGIMITKQFEIAKQYLSISQGWREWYNRGFKPLEDKEMEEVMARKPVTPYYDMAVGRARTLGRFLLQGRAAKALRCVSQYQTGLKMAYLRDEMIVTAETLTSMSDLGYRREQDRVESEAADDITRALGTLNRGRDMASTTVEFGAMAGGIYSDMATGAGEGFLKFLGYALMKREPKISLEYRLGMKVTRTATKFGKR